MDNEHADSTTMDDFENIQPAGGDADCNQDEKQQVPSCFAKCCVINNMHPEAVKLIFWRCPLKTGIVLGSLTMLLMSLCFLSVISVFAYASLSLLCCTFGWKLYSDILASIKSTSGAGHPFQAQLDVEMILPTEQIVEWAGRATECANGRLTRIRDMLLVKNYVDTIKFAVGLYCLKIIGDWFNLTTIILMSMIVMFSVPKIYELYTPQINNAMSIVSGHICKIWDQVKSKVPMLGKKEKTT